VRPSWFDGLWFQRLAVDLPGDCGIDHVEVLLGEHNVGFPVQPSPVGLRRHNNRPRKIGMAAVIGFNIGFLSTETE
jgi:hypothetical protein